MYVTGFPQTGRGFERDIGNTTTSGGSWIGPTREERFKTVAEQEEELNLIFQNLGLRRERSPPPPPVRRPDIFEENIKPFLPDDMKTAEFI